MDISKLGEEDLQLILKISCATTALDKYIVLLRHDFGYSLSKKDLAKVLNQSEQTIGRRIKDSYDIPGYKKSTEGKKASYIFTIYEVAKYLSNSVEIA